MTEGSKTVARGIASSKLDFWFFSSFWMSFAMNIIVTAAMKLIDSKSVLLRLVMGIPRPYHVCVIGQNSCMPGPVMRSPIRICCINAAKYGTAFFLYIAKTGRNNIVRIMIECVRPRWFRPGIIKSMSGIRLSRNISGRFMFVSSGFEHILAMRYAMER